MRQLDCDSYNVRANRCRMAITRSWLTWRSARRRGLLAIVRLDHSGARGSSDLRLRLETNARSMLRHREFFLSVMEASSPPHSEHVGLAKSARHKTWLLSQGDAPRLQVRRSRKPEHH